MDVSVVIPVFNAREYLASCLQSLIKQTYAPYEIVIVDNGSSDGTVDYVKKSFLSAKMVCLGANKGFCAAVNAGIRVSAGHAIMILNSDVILDPHCLAALVKAAQDSSSAAGLFSPKILRMDRQTIDSVGLVLSRSRRFYDRGAGELDCGQYEQVEPIWGVCCAAAFFKRQVLDAIAYKDEIFDEHFFFLGEDFDVSWRCRTKGFQAWFIPSAICYHVRGVTFSQGHYRQYLSLRNRYFLLIKNERFLSRSFLKDLLRIFLYDMCRLPYALLTNPFTIKALYEVLKYMPEMIRRRARGRGV